jgi:hypothetical protein
MTRISKKRTVARIRWSRGGRKASATGVKVAGIGTSNIKAARPPWLQYAGATVYIVCRFLSYPVCTYVPAMPPRTPGFVRRSSDAIEWTEDGPIDNSSIPSKMSWNKITYYQELALAYK